jgi:hypothetical protein
VNCKLEGGAQLASVKIPGEPRHSGIKSKVLNFKVQTIDLLTR